MKAVIGLLLFVAMPVEKSQAQYMQYALDKLDSIVKYDKASAPFALLYGASIKKTNEHIADLAPAEQAFVLEFENHFTHLFFEAQDSFQQKKAVPTNWKFFYNHDFTNVLQNQFAGMNTHINGDMTLAIAKIPSDSIRKYHKMLAAFQNKFDQIWDSMYANTLQYKKVKRVHQWSLGLSKSYGRKMIKRWRYRAIKNALLYYSNISKFYRKRKQVLHKMEKWNTRAIKHIG